MLMVNNLIGFGAFNAAPCKADFTDSADDASALTTYTFAGMDIGAAAADRRVVVCIGSNANARRISSVTVAGVSCTVIEDVNNSTRDLAMVITDSPIPSGTTADVAVTFAVGAQNGCAVGLYRVTGIGNITPHDSQKDITSALSVSLNIPANGVAIACVRDSGTGTAFTGVTEDVEQAVDGSVGVLALAHDEFESTQAGHTISAATTGGAILIAASWGP